MFTRTRTPLMLTAALIATFAVAGNSYGAPPLVVGDSSVARLTGRNKPRAIERLAEANRSATVVPSAMDLIPGGLTLEPGSGSESASGSDSAPGSGSGSGGSGSPPSNPDWMDIINGIGGILGPGGHGSGHGSGHHPGHHPGHQPGWIPGYPTPGSSSSGSSYVPSNPLPEAPTAPGTAVVVANPMKNDASISFVADGRRFTLAPGYQQVVRRGGTVEVRFDRGGSFGTARYTLRNGSFQFLVGDEGWNLFRKVYRVTLDNSANPFPFRYMVGNTIHQVPANGTRQYQEHAPLVVKFDPGTGRAATRTLDSGTYRIAVNPDLRLWDVQEVDPEVAIPDVASSLPPSPPLPMDM